jgi:histidinol-phosphate aminotransferase
VNRTLENNRLGVERLSEAFMAEGATPCESYANFVWVDLGRPARPVFQALLERGLVVRPGDFLGNPNCLRVSIGTEEEMKVFVEEFRSVMREAVAT